VLLPLRTTRSGAFRTKCAGCSDACGVPCNLVVRSFVTYIPKCSNLTQIVSCMHIARAQKQPIPSNVCLRTAEETIDVKTGPSKFGVCAHKHAPEQCAGYAARTL